MSTYIVSAIFSYIELFASLICSLSIFRLPIRYNFLKISIISMINAVITTYTFANFPNFAILINLSFFIIMLVVFFSLPFFYAILVAIIYFLSGGIVEYAAFLFVSNVLHFSEQSIEPGGTGSKIAYLITSLILVLIAWILQRKKIGFMFISKYFTLRQSVKGYNFAISAVLIVSIVSIQLTSILFNEFSINAIILIILLVLFLTGIYFAYKQNKKQLNEKYERLNNR